MAYQRQLLLFRIRASLQQVLAAIVSLFVLGSAPIYADDLVDQEVSWWLGDPDVTFDSVSSLVGALGTVADRESVGECTQDEIRSDLRQLRLRWVEPGTATGNLDCPESALSSPDNPDSCRMDGELWLSLTAWERRTPTERTQWALESFLQACTTSADEARDLAESILSESGPDMESTESDPRFRFGLGGGVVIWVGSETQVGGEVNALHEGRLDLGDRDFLYSDSSLALRFFDTATSQRVAPSLQVDAGISLRLAERFQAGLGVFGSVTELGDASVRGGGAEVCMGPPSGEGRVDLAVCFAGAWYRAVLGLEGVDEAGELNVDRGQLGGSIHFRYRKILNWVARFLYGPSSEGALWRAFVRGRVHILDLPALNGQPDGGPGIGTYLQGEWIRASRDFGVTSQSEAILTGGAIVEF